METEKISRKLLKRLPLYLDYLKTLPEAQTHVSATAIAQALGLGDVQVRKDLAKVSLEGQCRIGRPRAQLIQDIEKYLDQAPSSATILVGTGELGQALLDRNGFRESGLNVMARFDTHPTTKRAHNGKPIYSMRRLFSFCKAYDVRVGIIAVSADEAQAVCDGLVACGIQSIWNFAPVSLRVPDHVEVHSGVSGISM